VLLFLNPLWVPSTRALRCRGADRIHPAQVQAVTGACLSDLSSAPNFAVPLTQGGPPILDDASGATWPTSGP